MIYAGAHSDFDFISRPLDDIRNEISEQLKLGKQFFFFENSAETLFTNWIKKIQHLSSFFPQVPSSNFILLTGSANGKESYQSFCQKYNVDQPITVFGENFHDIYLRQKCNRILEKVKDYRIGTRDKKFLCFNKIQRPHRLMLALSLLEKNLVDQSFFSFQGSHPTWLPETLEDRGLPERYKWLLKKNYTKFPMTLNITPQRPNPVDIIEDDLYYFNNSYFSLVNESIFFQKKSGISSMMQDSEDCVFITEKTAKCLALKHPFVLAGFVGSLEVLKKQGYKTFSPFINEEYDKETDDNKRLNLIIKEVERLCNFTDDQWLEWQTGIKEIVDHNFRVFKTTIHIRPDEEFLRIFQQSQ